MIAEVSDKGGLKGVDWQQTIPFGNRTVGRMITIASGTFVAVDAADAAIRAIIETGGINPATLKSFLLRINIVGVGRFAVALTVDGVSGYKKGRLENERMRLQREMLALYGIKASYLDEGMWIAAEDATKEVYAAVDSFNQAVQATMESFEKREQALDAIGEAAAGIRQHNPSLLDEIAQIQEWGDLL